MHLPCKIHAIKKICITAIAIATVQIRNQELKILVNDELKNKIKSWFSSRQNLPCQLYKCHSLTMTRFSEMETCVCVFLIASQLSISIFCVCVLLGGFVCVVNKCETYTSSSLTVFICSLQPHTHEVTCERANWWYRQIKTVGVCV